MYDSTSTKVAELMSYFGRNTCITLVHDYGANNVHILSARTGNVIAEVDDLICLNSSDLQSAAIQIMGMKKFPRNRKMNRSWSPIRLTAKAEADREITRNTILWSAE